MFFVHKNWFANNFSVFDNYSYLNDAKRYGLQPIILLHEKDEQTQPTAKHQRRETEDSRSVQGGHSDAR